MICDKKNCTGCFACYNICPKEAIVMKKDEYGNVYPEIIKEKCIDCGLCKKVCPQLKEKLDLKEPITAYAMYNKDSKKRSESASGGAASTFYEHILNKKGVIYGASNLFGKEEFSFIRIEDKKDLYKVKGSKYVHCYINDILKQVKKDLLDNRDVIFIGTPCQVSGLKSFLMKEYDNLITIDIVCHGVPSQQLLFDEMEFQKINKKDISIISFRDDKQYNLKVLDKNKKIILEKKSSFIDYYRNFLQSNINRENCYSCRYAQRKRISDITIGDFWGLDKNSKVYDNEEKGISLIMPNTQKGLDLVKQIFEESIIEERTIEEACRENGQLNRPSKKSKKYNTYLKYYPSKGYKKTMKKMSTPKEKIKKKIYSNTLLYKTLKKIKNKIKHTN